MGLTENQNEILFIIYALISALSLVGSIFICIVYMSFKDLQIFQFKLVTYLAIVDAGTSLSFFLPSYLNDMICQAQAFLISFFTLSGVLWTSAIAHALYKSAIREYKDISIYHKPYILYACGLALLASIAPFITDSYGNANSWCWVRTDKDRAQETILRLLIYYGPLWLVIPFNLIVYLKVIIKINREISNINEEEFTRRQLIRKLLLYPLILIICQTPVTINRIHDYFDDDPEFALVLISGVGICINGLLNAIIYGCTESVKLAVASWWNGNGKLRSTRIGFLSDESKMDELNTF